MEEDCEGTGRDWLFRRKWEVGTIPSRTADTSSRQTSVLSHYRDGSRRLCRNFPQGAGEPTSSRNLTTRTPLVASHHAQCSSSVASGCSCKRGTSAAFKPTVFTPGGPGRGDSARLPVSRCRRRQRVNVAVETPNSRITSGQGVPRSSAFSARIRKSRE